MHLSPAQQIALAAHIRANLNATVAQALATRDDQSIADWYNGSSATDAWNEAMGRSDLFEATPITNFDGLTAGKRDAWKLLLEQASQAPLDFGRPKLRSAVIDIWAPTQATAVLAACTRKATRGENVFGGAVETAVVPGGTNVAATDLTAEGQFSLSEISEVLNLPV